MTVGGEIAPIAGECRIERNNIITTHLGLGD
jgi:hypothetical protein